MQRFTKALAVAACVAFQGVYAEETTEKANPVYNYAPGFGDVKVPILTYDNMEDFMTVHNHLLTFAYQKGKPSEHYAFNELKPVIGHLNSIDKSI